MNDSVGPCGGYHTRDTVVKGIKIFGAKLAALREEMHESQESLAQAIGVTRGAIARIEGEDVTGMMPRNFARLAKAAEMTNPQLLARIGVDGAGPVPANGQAAYAAAGAPFGAADVVQRIGDIVMWKLRAAAAKEGRAGPGEPDAERAEAFVRYAAQDLINMLAVVVPPGARRPLPDAPPALPRTTDAAGVATRKGTRSSQASAGGTSTSG